MPAIGSFLAIQNREDDPISAATNGRGCVKTLLEL
jgi:hypothetical protein